MMKPIQLQYLHEKVLFVHWFCHTIYSPHAFQKNLVERVPVKCLNWKKRTAICKLCGNTLKSSIRFSINLNQTLSALCIGCEQIILQRKDVKLIACTRLYVSMNESINWLALLLSEYSNEANESSIHVELRTASKLKQPPQY